jgi:hypothetical protein
MALFAYAASFVALPAAGYILSDTSILEEYKQMTLKEKAIAFTKSLPYNCIRGWYYGAKAIVRGINHCREEMKKAEEDRQRILRESGYYDRITYSTPSYNYRNYRHKCEHGIYRDSFCSTCTGIYHAQFH